VLRLRDAQIEFHDVTLAYRPVETVLDRMNLVADPGKVTALVGSSGGGKSTVFNLMLRLYEVSEGAILIDGRTLPRHRVSRCGSRSSMLGRTCSCSVVPSVRTSPSVG
jgi:ATP-binding cassette subfamily B protein